MIYTLIIVLDFLCPNGQMPVSEISYIREKYKTSQAQYDDALKGVNYYSDNIGQLTTLFQFDGEEIECRLAGIRTGHRKVSSKKVPQSSKLMPDWGLSK